MPEKKTIRAFLALDPPPDVLRRIAEIQGVLKKNIRGSISWVRPEGVHLTLKFFGDISTDQVAVISDAVAVHTAGSRPFTLEVKGFGVFPGLQRPRVLWIGISGEVDRLAILQRAIDRELEIRGFPGEERPFRAHLTLARIKSRQGLTGIEQALVGHEEANAGQFAAGSLTLFRSELTPQGAIYTVLDHFPFQGDSRSGN